MNDIINQNKLFLSLFLMFFVVVIGLIFNNNHGDAVLFFAKHRTGVLNEFFIFVTKIGEGGGYIFCMILLLIIGFRTIDVLMYPLLGLLVMGFSFIAKIFFAHTRPLPYFRALKMVDELNLIDGVYVFGGPTSFPSGHTTSGFALFALLAFFTWKKPFLVVLFFFTAVLIGISRSYLVQHFLIDILAGATLGVAIALFVKYIHSKIKCSENSILNKRFTRQRKF